MIYFLYGEDTYRSREKLNEIIEGYKKVHKSGLNLIYIDSEKTSFDVFYSNFKITPMFAEKKLIVLKNIFKNTKFQEEFFEKFKEIEKLKDIVIIYEEQLPDKRLKIFKALTDKKGDIKSQNFEKLGPVELRKWVDGKFKKNGAKIDVLAQAELTNFVGNDLWRMSNEINKLMNYKKGEEIKKEDIEVLVKPNVENDIFRTIEALAVKNKKLALFLFRKHLEAGDNELYLFSMIAYQFRNLLILKELQQHNTSRSVIIKKSELHPFVVQKTLPICNKFTIDELKRIYWKIFQIDTDIKAGKVEAETALDLMILEI